MSITIRYFASLKEKLGRASDEIEIAEMSTAGSVWQKANPNCPIPENTLVAVNMDYVDRYAQVQDGDEVAFFPPVTGG